MLWSLASEWLGCKRSMVRIVLAVWHPLLQMAPGCEVYAVCSCTSFAMHYVAQIPVWCLMWDLVYYLFTWFLLDVMWNHLWDVLVVMSHHVLFEIPLSLCWWDTHVSPCMFALRSLLCHVSGMLIIIMHEFYVILIGVLFWLRVPVAEHLLAPLLREGIFLVW